MSETPRQSARVDLSGTATPVADAAPIADSKPAVNWGNLFEAATLESNTARPARAKMVVPAEVLTAVEQAFTLKRRISLPVTAGDDAGIKLLADTFYAAGDQITPPVSVQVQTVNADGEKCANKDAVFIKVYVGARRGKRVAEVIALKDAGKVIDTLRAEEDKDKGKADDVKADDVKAEDTPAVK